MHRRKRESRCANFPTCHQVRVNRIPYLRKKAQYSLREIARLNERVKELEERLKGAKLEGGSEEPNEVKLEIKALPIRGAVSLPTNLDPLGQYGGNKKYYNCE
jgi:flagellar motility protein MotE (MotC chaperone)